MSQKGAIWEKLCKKNEFLLIFDTPYLLNQWQYTRSVKPSRAPSELIIVEGYKNLQKRCKKVKNFGKNSKKFYKFFKNFLKIF